MCVLNVIKSMKIERKEKKRKSRGKSSSKPQEDVINESKTYEQKRIEELEEAVSMLMQQIQKQESNNTKK